MLDQDDAIAREIGGARLAVCERGEGAPVIFVHGSASDLRTWSDPFDAVSRHHRAIVYSRRYFHPNTPIGPEDGDPIARHVADLAALIDDRGAAPAHVVGHSWGALIALLLAIEQPRLVSNLVLIEPPTVGMHVDMPPSVGQILRLMARKPRLAFAILRLGAGAFGPAEKAFRRGDENAAIAYFGRGVLGPRVFAALTHQRYAQVWDNRGPERALALYPDFPDLRMDWRQVSCPVLVLCGAQSPALFSLLAEELVAVLPDARLRMIPAASHLVHEDAPQAVNAALIEFLGSQA